MIRINPLLFQFKTQEFQAEMKKLLLMVLETRRTNLPRKYARSSH